MSQKEVQFIHPPNNLRQKQKLAGVSGTIDSAWMDAAERSILSAKVDYIEAAQEDMARLAAAYDKAMSDPANRVAHIQ